MLKVAIYSEKTGIPANNLYSFLMIYPQFRAKNKPGYINDIYLDMYINNYHHLVNQIQDLYYVFEPYFSDTKMAKEIEKYETFTNKWQVYAYINDRVWSAHNFSSIAPVPSTYKVIWKINYAMKRMFMAANPNLQESNELIEDMAKYILDRRTYGYP